MLHSLPFFFTGFLHSTVALASLLSDGTASQGLCLEWVTLLMHTLSPISSEDTSVWGSTMLLWPRALCPDCFLLSHLSLIMLPKASLAVRCLPLSVECWPPESWGLASFSLNSQFLYQVIVPSVWRLECEFKGDNLRKSPDQELTVHIFTSKSHGLLCFIPWLFLQFSFFLLVKMYFVSAQCDTCERSSLRLFWIPPPCLLFHSL